MTHEVINENSNRRSFPLSSIEIDETSMNDDLEKGLDKLGRRLCEQLNLAGIIFSDITFTMMLKSDERKE